MLEQIESKGIHLSEQGGELIVDTSDPLTAEQRTFLKKNKAELITALRLREIAPDLSELMSWYKEDYDDIAAMTFEQVESLVADYRSRRDIYLKIQGA